MKEKQKRRIIEKINTMQGGSANFVVCRSSYWNLHHNSRRVHQLSSKFVNNKYSISDLCRLSFCRLYKKARRGKPNGFTKYFVGNLISISVILRYNVVSLFDVLFPITPKLLYSTTLFD